MTQPGMVIIGAGEAGANAAMELRNQGYAGSITLIGKENRTPYERPPLSKSVLLEEEAPAPTFMLDAAKLEELNIQLLSDSHVTSIDRDAHRILLADGRELSYEKLLLATGASPRRLNMEGSDTSGALYLRTFSDALAIRSRLHPGKHIVIVGGGFIGLEVAASARERGCDVTLLEVGPRILTRGVPEEIANVVEARHREAGVTFKIGTAISRITNDNGSQIIEMADGTVIRCDALIIGIGAVPEIALAEGCGLAIENGIRADEKLATSDPDIFAAGDCCSFPLALYGGTRVRLESWRNAQDQGIHAAQNMLGADQPYEAIPWFWSDQYDESLQVAGLVDFGSANKIKRESADNVHFFFHLAEDGTLAAASGIGPGIAKDIRLAEMLIERKAVIDPAVLASASTKLKSLLK
ncbi:NAD(P)/FAD-dependent oxidoreductase [Paenibacillus lignilyticus]|uniref:FAD-dependent oxidoreductase n=1 Tax=Paenibacillus lignilyticus TaxID=1172615 RepID=A0ABS5C9P9_9BACL|nr:FAD-dependent oxidoreductase [Paenibacillus lignilyticus]MBP3962710.1 FAD-dependent oxidoreductase [Paenibacillus lignilyticus]